MTGTSGNCRSSIKPQRDDSEAAANSSTNQNMSCGTAQVSYQGIRISLKLLAVFPRHCALAARGASDLTGPSPSRRQETASRNPRRSGFDTFFHRRRCRPRLVASACGELRPPSHRGCAHRNSPQNRINRGNIAKAFPYECVSFRDGEDARPRSVDVSPMSRQPA
jgi:hypothetical protein